MTVGLEELEALDDEDEDYNPEDVLRKLAEFGIDPVAMVMFAVRRAESGSEILDNGGNPLKVIAASFLYGFFMGVEFSERDRSG